MTYLIKMLPPASSIANADDVTIGCHGDNQAIAVANAVNFIAFVIKCAVICDQYSLNF